MGELRYNHSNDFYYPSVAQRLGDYVGAEVVFLGISSYLVAPFALILGLSFSALETVATETLSSLAMSFIVMGVFFSGIGFYFTKQK